MQQACTDTHSTFMDVHSQAVVGLQHRHGRLSLEHLLTLLVDIRSYTLKNNEVTLGACIYLDLLLHSLVCICTQL